MSAMLNAVGLMTLMAMSAVLLNGAGFPLTSLIHSAAGYLQGYLPFQLP